MQAAFSVLATRSRMVDGVPTSFADLGYSDAGVDDCWQQCGGGTGGYTYHNATDGRPVVKTSTFPDMGGMVSFAHGLNLTAGFYSNNCACADHCSDPICFAGDVDQILDWGFDSVKLDGCGKEESIELWSDLFNWTIRARGGKRGMMLENCHNGPNTPRRNPDWCPFHMYRASTDIAPVYGSILANLQTIVDLAAQNLSYPGCWAYTDMLEVGVTNRQNMPSTLSLVEARTHFHMWCIISSPLILGLNLSDSATVDSIWPIVSNREAIAVNQQYAGFSGTIFYSSPEATAFAPCGWWLANCSFPSVQFLYKPLPAGDTAVLLVNSGDAAADLALTFASVPGLSGTATYSLRDVGNRAPLGSASGSWTAKGVGSRDSVFLRLTPQ